jgi:hypothetical protein
MKSWAKVFIGVVLVGAIIVAGLVGLGMYRFRTARQSGVTMPGMAFFAQRRPSMMNPQAPGTPAPSPNFGRPGTQQGGAVPRFTPGAGANSQAPWTRMPMMRTPAFSGFGSQAYRSSMMQTMRSRMPFMMLGMLFIAWLALSFGSAAFWAVSKVFLGERTNMVWQTVRQAPLRSLGYGILTCIALSLAAVALAITMIGIPLAMLTVATGALLAVIGYAGLAKGVGMSILRGDDHPEIMQALTGGLVLSILIFIPFIGWATIALLIYTGIGALASVLWPEIAGRDKKSDPAPQPTVVA